MTKLEPASKEELAAFKAARAKPERKPPSLYQQAKSLGGAVARHIMAGAPAPTRNMIDERWAICQACPLFKIVPKGQGFMTLRGIEKKGNCTSCGCWVHGELIHPNKLALPQEQCPEGKWKQYHAL